MKLPALLLTLAALSLQAQTPPSLTGRWLATFDFYGAVRYLPLNLQQQGDELTGDFEGDKLEGTLSAAANGKDKAIHFLAKDSEGGTEDVTGTVTNGIITANVIELHHDGTRELYKITATIAPARPTAAPQRHEFTPTVFYRSYSPFNKPVLTINPGDTVHTTTVDAGGVDATNTRRSPGGNPETGPFYIQSAMPGDTLVVHITHLKLNRNSAGSDDGVVESALNSNLAVKMKDNGKDIPWSLDLAKGTATPTKPDVHLAHYTVPLHPMLGCIATAVGPGSASPPGSGDSGNYGGNMDFNEIAEGSTIYLPVSNPGALLYLGDAHAAMGDGEINGNALETSSDIEFTVDVIPNKSLRFPRVETPTHIISLGYEGNLDDAFRDATSNMAQWLTQDYSLNPSELAQVIGTAAEYKVTEVADRNSGIALKINKDRLTPLTKTTTTKPVDPQIPDLTPR
jgi:amidase